MANAMFIGLAGNPNCGKTTLFNELTGSNGYVGNWPGVTVEKKQAPYKRNKAITFVDLPGIYSLSPYTPEEVVSRDYLINERPHAVIDLLDVTNLERNLYLTTQLLECGLPTVVGLNMCDLLKARGDVVNAAELAQALGVPVIELSALKNKGVDQLITAAQHAATEAPATGVACFSPQTEAALTAIAALIHGRCPEPLTRWYAIKLFERDAQAIAPLALPDDTLATIETHIAAVEAALDDDAESIITAERYEWIADVVSRCVTRAPKTLTRSERIDRVITNRVLGLPIFVGLMIAVYWFAMVAVGTPATDWVNDNLFGDGYHLFGNGDAAYTQAADAYQENHYQDKLDGFLAAAEAAGLDTTAASEALAAEDYTSAAVTELADAAAAEKIQATGVPIHDADGNFVDTEGNVLLVDANGDPIVHEGQTLETLDIVTAQDFADAVEHVAEAPAPEDYGVWIPGIPTLVTDALTAAGASDVVISMVVDGIIAGVGSVLGFIPQMVALFIVLAFLEDCGYMSRVAFVMDRVFRRFGLSGKSFIPLLISSGCGVPGVLSTKTIENENDRRMTAMLTTMIPCSAKQPIIALLLGSLAGQNFWWVAPMFYFLGVAAIVISAVMLKKTRPFAGEPAPFVMELPDYHMPTAKTWALHVWERVSSYIKKAGTIIFAAAVGIWVLSNFGFANWEGGSGAFGFLSAMDAPDNFMDYSLLAAAGNLIAWPFTPLGFGNWQASASSISALIAKENLVSTFAVLFGLGDASEASASMWSGFAQMFTTNGVLHVGAMVGFVAFNMLNAPCFAAIGTIRRQLNNRRWFWFAIGYQCGIAWVVALIINQLWDFFVLGTFGAWTVVAFACLAAIVFQTFRPMPKFEKRNDKILERLSAESM